MTLAASRGVTDLYSILHKDIEHARTIFCVKLSIKNHTVGLVHKNHIIRTCLMYHAACKVEFQPFQRSYSQLTFFNFLQNIILRFYGPYDTYALQFFYSSVFKSGFSRACWRSFGTTSYLPQPPIVFASSSIDKDGYQLSTAGIRQQPAAVPNSQQQQQPPANSSTPNRPESISHLETVSATRLHRVLRSRVNDYGKKWMGRVCLLYTSPSPRDGLLSRMPSSA